MKTNQIAAQLYTVRDHIKDPESIAASLKKVREIGYTAVQVSGMGPIAEADLKALLDQLGLVCCATHEPGDKILADPQAVAARLKKLSCSQVAYPHPGNTPLATLDDLRAFAKALESSGRVLAGEGITLSYHNHDNEFKKVKGKGILEWIYELTDPRYLKAELDTLWVRVGGGDPTAWCAKMKDRMLLIHLKDGFQKPDKSWTMAEVGSGTLDFKAILPAAEKAGCEWFIVEQDTCEGDPFDALGKSYDYLVKTFCGGA